MNMGPHSDTTYLPRDHIARVFISPVTHLTSRTSPHHSDYHISLPPYHSLPITRPHHVTHLTLPHHSSHHATLSPCPSPHHIHCLATSLKLPCHPVKTLCYLHHITPPFHHVNTQIPLSCYPIITSSLTYRRDVPVGNISRPFLHFPNVQAENSEPRRGGNCFLEPLQTATSYPTNCVPTLVGLGPISCHVESDLS